MADGSRSAFQFGPPGSIDELGVWGSPATSNRNTPSSFGLPGAQTQTAVPEGVNYFMADLPADASLATEVLNGRQSRLQRAGSGVSQAGWRLGQFKSSGLASSASSFALPGSPQARMLQPEIDLKEWIKPAGSGGESFGRIGGLPSDWKEVSQATSAFFDKIHNLLRFNDLVESRLEGERLGLSQIDLSGDFTNLWQPYATQAQAALHEKLVRQAIQSRTTWINMGFMVVRGGLLIAGLFTNPVMALPAAYKFFRQVLEQVQNIPVPSRG